MHTVRAEWGTNVHFTRRTADFSAPLCALCTYVHGQWRGVIYLHDTFWRYKMTKCQVQTNAKKIEQEGRIKE